MREKRTTVDFSNHVLEVVKTDEILVHHLRVPGTLMRSIKFINTNGILAVTGDYGNWILCREFHPSADGYVSDHYWVEKLKISSCQDPYVFDAKVAKENIKDLLTEHELSDEEKEWLNELSEEADQGEYSFIAKAMDRPGSFEAEMIPHGKKLNEWLQIIFDGFDEICRRETSKG
jgi:hypothetical protein